MSPPLLVTEDTPPDMLTGHMDLRLVLPNGNRVRMSVDRRTPMMDLLVQVTTAYKISPAGHVLQPYGECGILPYKPSTPIGALDTWTVHIVPKHQALQNPASKISLKQVQQPFEQTFRFQVNLPKNQLYVTRVTGRTMMGDLLRQACSEKGLDHNKYVLRHPKHLDRILNEDLSVMEYGHNQVSMVSNKTLPSSVSSEDILAMAAYSGKSSESSSRSLSPDSSVSPQAPVQPSRPLRKRRPAPKPPVQPNQSDQKAKPKEKRPPGDPPSNGPVICHSRTSSDSSGYHEASVLSESPDSNNSSLPDSLPRRSKLPSKTESSKPNNKPSNKLSRSLSNLHHESTAPSTSMKPAQSTSCLAPSRKKKPAPPPPVLAIEEEKEEVMSARGSQTLPPGVRLVDDPVEHRVQHRPSDPSSRLASPANVANRVEPKGNSQPVDVSPTQSKLETPNKNPIPNTTRNFSYSFEETAVHSVTGSPAKTSPNVIPKSVAKLATTYEANQRSASPDVHSQRTQSSSTTKLPRSPLFEELDTAFKAAQVTPETQQISVRDLLKKFADSAKPAPNFTLTTYDPKEVRRITKYSETGTSYYNYDLNNVHSPDSPSRMQSILKIANPETKQNLNCNSYKSRDNLDSNKNNIVNIYSNTASEKEVKPFYHTRKSSGSLTSNIKELYENSTNHSKPTNLDIREELDNITKSSNVRRYVDAYSERGDSFDSEFDEEKPRKLMMEPSVDNEHSQASKCRDRKSFFDDMIMGVKRDENSNFTSVDRDNNYSDEIAGANAFDEDVLSEVDSGEPEKVRQDSISTNSSIDATGDSVIEEINRVIDSAGICEDLDDDTDEFSKLKEEFRVSPVVGVQKMEDVFNEYATEFTNIPIVIVRDEDEPETALNVPRPRSPYLHEPAVAPESPKRARKAVYGPKFERTDSSEIGGFEGPKSPGRWAVVSGSEVPEGDGNNAAKAPGSPKICFAKEESLEVEVVKDLTEPPDDSISIGSTSSDGTTIREANQPDPEPDLPRDTSQSHKSKTVTFNPQPEVQLIAEPEGPSISKETPPKLSKSPKFSPKITFDDLKRRGKKFFSSSRTKAKSEDSDWNHRDLTEPGFCECPDPDVVLVRVPKAGKRNQAFKIKDKRQKKVTFAKTGATSSDVSETLNKRLKDFLASKEVAPPKPLRRRVFFRTTDQSVFDRLAYLMKRRSVQEGLIIEEEPTISHKSLSDLEAERVEDEIERMFEEATREHVSLESGVDVCDSSPGLPSPEASGLPSPDLIPDAPHEPLPTLPDTPIQKSDEDDPFNWEYKLPAPPTFRDVVDRDDTSSPLLTEYSTMTVGNMKEVLYQPSAAGDRPEPPKVIGVMERRAQERAAAQELAAVDRRPASLAMADDRRAVAEELAAVVDAPNRGLAALKDDSDAPKADAAVLDNFRITTYSGIKESVKVFEEKTTPKRHETNLARRSSFTDNEQPQKTSRPHLAGGVKRSVSHVSPLTRARMGLSVSNVDLANVGNDRIAPRVSNCDPNHPEPSFHLQRTGLRKTTSELSINIDLSDERDHYDENGERENGLQSISVLRSIMPQMSRSQTALNYVDHSSNEKSSGVREDRGGFRRPNISLSTWGERPKRQISIKSDKDYVIGGAKTVNDAKTLNGHVGKPAAARTEKPLPPEKPAAGVVKAPSFKGPKTMAYKMLETGNTKPLKQILERDKFVEPTKNAQKIQEYNSSDGLESDHVPIVRAVELKKPYKMELENRMIKDPVPPPSLPDDVRPTPFFLRPTAEPVANRSALFDQRRPKPTGETENPAGSSNFFDQRPLKPEGNQMKPAVDPAKSASHSHQLDQRRLKPAAEPEKPAPNPSALFDQRRLKPTEARKPAERPVSCYLFGYEPSIPSPPNPPPPPKKYTSIVDLSRPLKPVGLRSSKPRQREVDPREELMASIRTFGKNSLRKVSAR